MTEQIYKATGHFTIGWDSGINVWASSEDEAEKKAKAIRGTSKVRHGLPHRYTAAPLYDYLQDISSHKTVWDIQGDKIVNLANGDRFPL